MRVNMLEAKNQLSRLVKAAVEGKEVVIAKGGKSMVQSVPVADQMGLKGRGKLRDLACAVDDAFSPEVEAEVALRLFRSE